MDVQHFREKVRAYLRPTDHSQQELAQVLGLQPQVLSRKLHAQGRARLTHREVKLIVRTLAQWQAIATQAEALELLALMQLPASSFSAVEWSQPPLDRLEAGPPPSADDAGDSARPLAPHMPSAPDRPAIGLPAPLTGLVGRSELAERAAGMLRETDTRLLTLTGPGGIGKTRLAIEIGQRLLPAFAGEVAFVDLSATRTPTLVPATIARALGMAPHTSSIPLAALVERLRQRACLLILDNFEHVVGAAGLVGELLAHAPRLKLLITSRVILNAYGEHLLSVPPLDLPDLSALPDDPTLLQRYATVQLFAQRARAANANFQLTPANAGAVLQICHLTEGIPLAIELAAARTRHISPALIAARLGQGRLATLHGGPATLAPRQQALRSTLDWSFELLDADERQLLARLGVFAGSIAPAAAAQICCLASEPPLDLLDLLGRLADKSLLVPRLDMTPEPRFALLETIREYALEQLAARGEVALIQDRYQGYFRALAEDFEAHIADITTMPQPGQLDQFELDYENIQAALAPSSSLAAAPGEPPATSSPVHTQPAVQVECSIVIDRPIDEVFAFVSNPDLLPRWHTLVQDVRRSAPGPGAKGDTFIVTNQIMGRSYQVLVEIVECVPNQVYAGQSAGGPFHFRTQGIFASVGHGTRITASSTLHLHPVFRVTRPILLRMAHRSFETFLHNLKRILEEEA